MGCLSYSICCKPKKRQQKKTKRDGHEGRRRAWRDNNSWAESGGTETSRWGHPPYAILFFIFFPWSLRSHYIIATAQFVFSFFPDRQWSQGGRWWDGRTGVHHLGAGHVWFSEGLVGGRGSPMLEENDSQRLCTQVLSLNPLLLD